MERQDVETKTYKREAKPIDGVRTLVLCKNYLLESVHLVAVI